MESIVAPSTVFAAIVVGGGWVGGSDRVADEDADWARKVIVNAPAIAISRNKRPLGLAKESRLVMVKSPRAIVQIRMPD
jgi:hypothetical protein